MLRRIRDLVLRTKISALLVALTTIVSVALAGSLYSLASRALNDSLRTRLEHVASTTSLLLPPELVDQVHVSADAGGQAFALLSKRLEAARRVNRLKSAYVLRQTGSAAEAEFVVDVSEGVRAAIGTRYALEQAPAAVVGFSRPSTDEEIVVDEYGATLSGYAPIVRPDGSVAGLVGVDMDATDVLLAQRTFALTCAGIFVGLLVLSLLLAVAFARVVTRPIEVMTRGVEAISAGDLAYRVAVTSNDELGRLSMAINRMVGTLAVYLPVRLVGQILGGNSQLGLGGQRTAVTVFFSDIAGFTTISESMRPDELVALMNEYLTAMSDVIEDGGGTIDKYIGDAIMAFWGAPEPTEDHALLACEAALRQLSVHAKVSAEWRRQGKPECLFRIGLNSGEAVIGNMGSARRFNYTAMGDAVNLASRLEGAGKEYGVRTMVGEATRQLAAGKYEFRTLDRLTVKGKTVPVTVFELIGRTGELDAGTIEFRDTFERGLAAYFDQRWDVATAEFARARALRPTDGPAAVFMERTEEFRLHSPGPGWNGAYSMLHK